MDQKSSTNHHWERLWAAWGVLGQFGVASGLLRGASSRLGGVLKPLGPSWGRLGGVFDRLGGVLRASIVRRGASWLRLGPSWVLLGFKFHAKRLLNLGMPSWVRFFNGCSSEFASEL